ncbi:MAG: PHP domain-containing protein [Oscillatoriophycideae cyanobacterium NC_groundwater_1537_Pr4_S-0.65um_50_18]|nr:PHP domain-containing protein [Oscillatoriophycideae cyanobacterium NC_groundwater_1537_Pr4_S-0.65um_50_18]
MAVDLAHGFASSAAHDTAALRSVLESITAESCPRSYNFHMHTVCSDGRLQPEHLLEQAIAIGLKGLAITDHHSVMGYRRAQQWLSAQRSNGAASLRLWTGMEVTSSLLGDEVHILAYAFDPGHLAIQPYIQSKAPTGEFYLAKNVIAAIHAAGGLAVLAHPARYRRSHSELVPEAARLGIDGIETYYAYNNPSPWKASPKQTQEVKALGRTYGLLSTCGTDTHGLSLLQRI